MPGKLRKDSLLAPQARAQRSGARVAQNMGTGQRMGTAKGLSLDCAFGAYRNLEYRWVLEGYAGTICERTRLLDPGPGLYRAF
jgi:hypothetical protein